ncbi:MULTISPECIES: hypothetical protein [unclassified Streptomyces]|uniref:hypothetical protein n=1 Tax=unclassified Streptomyces TaxID=2593676 RepID=UPI001F0DA1D0|nr:MULTISPECIES: hypothetical protein [unclassified Streptomyces]
MNSLTVEMRLKAREEIQREVTGLTAEQIHERLVAAGGLESREDQPRPLSTEERLAAVRRNELRRIWNLMGGTAWDAYSSENDAQADRWRQALQDRQEGASGGAVEPDSELIRYRIVAQRTDPAHPGASVVTNYTYARSVEEAVTKAHRAKEKPGGLYGDQGLYRVVEAVEESPQSEARQLHGARGRFLTAVMDAAVAALDDQSATASLELIGILSEFFFDTVFTRAIVSADSGEEHAQLYARDGEVLSRLLLAHLADHGLDLEEARARTGELRALPDLHTGVGRPSLHGEEIEAPAELIERVLAVCEQHYAAVTGTSSEQWDQESSRELVDIALRTVHLAEPETYPRALDAYLHEHRARLERLWSRYGPGGMFAGELVLIDLPGCFALCERIETTPLWLEGIWAKHSQEETALERLHNSWLYDTSEKDGR